MDQGQGREVSASDQQKTSSHTPPEKVVLVGDADNSTTVAATVTGTETEDDDHNDNDPNTLLLLRGISSTAKTTTSYYPQYGQTDPPTIPIEELFSKRKEEDTHTHTLLPTGQILSYNNVMEGQSCYFGETTAEARVAASRDSSTCILQNNNVDNLTKFRKAAEVHRQVRAYAQRHLLHKPGICTRTELCENIENMTRRLVQERGLQAGIAFPTGVSINEVAAHYTPNPGGRDSNAGRLLQYNDVLKVDFGVQIDGYIIDSAWTVAYNPRYDNLLEACREATNTGIAESGIDARLAEIGTAIQETMESYEVELDGTTYPIKPIRNLKGHSIELYRIHGKNRVPVVGPNNIYGYDCSSFIFNRLVNNWMGGYGEAASTKMEEGQVYAIETFASTGRGCVQPSLSLPCSHYMLKHSHSYNHDNNNNNNNNNNPPPPSLLQPSSQKLLSHIQKTFGTLCFCRRWLEREDGGSAYLHGIKGNRQTKYMGPLLQLCDEGLVEAYPPLVDIPGSYTAQYEHTLILRSTCKEVLSRGDDY